MADQSYWQKITADRVARRRFLRGAAFSGAGLAAAAMVGCGGSDSGGGGGAATEDDGPLAANQVLNVRFYDDPGGFDPATLFRIEVENIAFNVYSGLTTYDAATSKILPDLADSWETPSATQYI